MNGPRFITIDEFDNYWGANLREMLRDSANPSNQADLFLARVENRLMSYIDNNTFRRYRYEDLRGGQLAAFKEAIILQAMYVYKNGDIGMDSGYDAEHGTLVKRTELVEISVCQDAIDILSNAGLWNLAMKNKPRTFGSSFGDLVGGGTTFVSSSSTATVDLSSVLKLTGGTMQGNIDMGSNSIVNIAMPNADTDVTNKKYVDELFSSVDLSGYFKKDGSVAMTGGLNLNNNSIDNIYNINSRKDINKFVSTDNGQTFTIETNNQGSNNQAEIRIYKEYDTSHKRFDIILYDDVIHLGCQTSLNGNTEYAYFMEVAKNGTCDFLIGAQSDKVPSVNKDLTNKKYVDELISAIKKNAFTLVDTTTYTTLDSFLATTGEEGYIYLYPLDLNDISKGYYQYIYENNAWLSLGTTQIDLSDYVKKSGDTMTGALNVPTINNQNSNTQIAINTGTNANSYFQSRKFRGQGDANAYNHAIDFGYSGHDRFDFYEYGGVFNFWMNSSSNKLEGNGNRVASLQLGKLLERGNTLTYPNKSGTFALISDLDSVLKLSGGTMSGNIDMGVNSFTNVKETHYTISSEIGEVAVFKAESITYDDDVISIGASLYTKQLNATSLAVHFGWGVDDPIRIYRKITGNNNVLDFNANRLTNIATPVNDTDAVNKSYVEKSVKLTNELYLNDSNNVQCDTNLDVNATIVGDEIYETPADYTITNLRETLSVSSSGSATITPLNCKVDKIGNRLTITGAFGMRGTSEGTIEVQTVNEPAFGIVLPSGIYSKITDLNDKYVGSCTMKATGTYYTGNEELRIVFIDAGNNTIATMLYVSNTWNIENNNLMTYGTIFTYELTLLLGDSLF